MVGAMAGAGKETSWDWGGGRGGWAWRVGRVGGDLLGHDELLRRGVPATRKSRRRKRKPAHEPRAAAGGADGVLGQEEV